MNSVSIDINQRIPLYALEVALNSFLADDYSNEYILEQLRLDFEGENRLKKALRIVNRIVIHNPLVDFVETHGVALKSALKSKSDKDVILISLLNSAFPFSFEVLKIFGKYFSAQDLINSDIIKKSISNKFGGNRATENGLYSVIPMFIEANVFKRPKQGFYEWKEPIMVSSPISLRIYQESFKYNNQMQELQDFQKGDPYFMFVELI